MEGVDFAFNHNLFPIFPYFGCNFIDTGGIVNVQNLFGEDETFAEGFQFEYQYGSDSDFEVDEISANEGTIFFTSQDSIGRGVCSNGPENYNTIFTSIMFGAIIDGESPNTKADLMATYLNFLTQPIVEAADSIVEQISLSNYPNPFNPSTNISFSLDETAHATLEIYNIKGEKIKTLADNELSSGLHTVEWDGKDKASKSAPSGVYFCKMKVGEFIQTKKMILLK